MDRADKLEKCLLPRPHNLEPLHNLSPISSNGALSTTGGPKQAFQSRIGSIPAHQRPQRLGRELRSRSMKKTMTESSNRFSASRVQWRYFEGGCHVARIRHRLCRGSFVVGICC